MLLLLSLFYAHLATAQLHYAVEPLPGPLIAGSHDQMLSITATNQGKDVVVLKDLRMGFFVGPDCAQCLSTGVSGDLDRCESGNETAYSCILSYGSLNVVFNRGPLEVGADAVRLLLVLHQVGSPGSANVAIQENGKEEAAVVVNKVRRDSQTDGLTNRKFETRVGFSS